MSVLTRIYLLVVGIASIAGEFSAFYPPIDILNYFRPWLLLASIPALILFLSRQASQTSRIAGLLIATVNLAYFFYPVLSNPAGPQDLEKTKPLKIISFNVWHLNTSLQRVADFLQKEEADVVLLQEMPSQNLKSLRRYLGNAYPFIHTCDCRNMVLLSRYPWEVAGGGRLTWAKPATIWARLTKPGRGSYRIVGVHTATPFYPEMHTNHTQWLATKLPRDERLIVAGDFNATPWSNRLISMTTKLELQRSATFQHTWPSHFLMPLFLIDNVFVSQTIKINHTRIGPDLGSDHRPVIVDLGMTG